MGDRCYLQAWVRQEDYAKFCNILVGAYVPPRSEREGWALYEDGQAPYGSFDERMEAAKNGLIFVGESSGAYGWEYNAEAFYSDGTQMYSQDISSSHSSSYIISIDPVTGKLDEKEVGRVNEFDKKWREMHDKVIGSIG
jgi:hypothetical protein